MFYHTHEFPDRPGEEWDLCHSRSSRPLILAVVTVILAVGHSEQKRPTWGAVRAKEAYKILTAAARKRLFLRTLSEKFRVRADLEIGKGKTPEYIPTTDLDSVL